MKPTGEKLKGILKTIFIANRAYYISKYLHEPDSTEENKIILNSEFLRFSRYAYLYMAVIELNKVIDNNDSHKHNLHKLLNTMENNLKSFNKKISREDISNWREKLNSVDKSVLEKLKNLRDKLYAHLDLNESGFIDKNSVLITEIGDALDVAKQIVNLIYQKLGDGDWKFDIPPEVTISERHVKRILHLQETETQWLKDKLNGGKE